MISWLWLILAYYIGAISAVIFIGLVNANRDDGK